MSTTMFQRKKFSIRRNSTKRWKQAISGSDNQAEPFSVVIKSTSMNLDQQRQAVEIANMALDVCGIESEIATYIKTRYDELTGSYISLIVILIMFLTGSLVFFNTYSIFIVLLHHRGRVVRLAATGGGLRLFTLLSQEIPTPVQFR